MNDEEYEEFVQNISSKSDESQIVHHFKAEYFSLSQLNHRAQNASVPSAAFNLINTILGAGILTIPFNFNRTGYANGVLFQVAFAVLAYFSFQLLTKSARTTKCFNYQFLVSSLINKPVGWLAGFSVLVFTFCVLVSFCVIMRDNMFFLHDHGWKVLLMWGILIFLILPLALLPDLNSLWMTSFLAILCVFYIVGCLFAFNALNAQGKMEFPEHLPSVAFQPVSMQFLTAIPTFALCFAGHFNSLNVYQEIQGHSTRKMGRVAQITCSVILFLNLSIGVAGYLLFTDQTQGDLLKNLDALPESPYLVYAQICNIAIMVVMICSYPLLCFCFRMCLQQMIFGLKHQKYALHASFAVGTSLVVGLIASFIDDISIVLDIASAVAGVPLVIIFPALLGVRWYWEDNVRWRRTAFVTLNVLFAVFGVFLVGLGIVCCVYGLVAPFP